MPSLLLGEGGAGRRTGKSIALVGGCPFLKDTVGSLSIIRSGHGNSETVRFLSTVGVKGHRCKQRYKARQSRQL